MRYVLIGCLLAGCADKASVQALQRENETLNDRIAKLETKAPTAPPPKTTSPAKASELEKDKQQVASGGAAFSALDHKIAGVARGAGMKLDEVLDEHGRIRDMKTVATKLREKIIKQNGGEESAWRAMAGWLGLPTTAAIMNGTVSARSSGEEVVPADRALAEMEQQLLSGNPGVVASNLGFKLSETVTGDGHFKDPRAICTHIRDFYAKRGEQGHGAMLEEYGRMVGTEIWTGALCQKAQ